MLRVGGRGGGSNFDFGLANGEDREERSASVSTGFSGSGADTAEGDELTTFFSFGGSVFIKLSLSSTISVGCTVSVGFSSDGGTTVGLISFREFKLESICILVFVIGESHALSVIMPGEETFTVTEATTTSVVEVLSEVVEVDEI